MKLFWQICFFISVVLATVFIVLYFTSTKQPTTTEPDQNIHHNFIYAPEKDSFIQHVYYINLDSRTDRKYHIETQLNRIGFEPHQITRIPGVVSKFGALGCSQAHYNALQAFESSTFERVLIIEDDALFGINKDQFLTQLSKFQNLYWNWDILMLACVAKKWDQTDVDFLLRILDGQTTAAYVVNRSYLPRLLDNIQNGISALSGYESSVHEYCIDIYWKSLQRKHNWFAIYPFLVHQRDDFSDIEQRNVSYIDKNPLPLKDKTPIEYIVCVKTCQPRLANIDIQKLEDICKDQNIRYFIYLGNPQQEQPILCDNHVVTLKCKDDYLNLCHKMGLMFRFLLHYVHNNALCSNFKGVFFTDDDIHLNPELFYSFLQRYQHLPYWGKTATYTNTNNTSNHLMDKAKESHKLKQFLTEQYPDLLLYGINVPKVTFCAGGGFFLSPRALTLVSSEDEHFIPFPSKEDLKYHLKKENNNSVFHNLHVFDDTEVALALQKKQIFAIDIPDLHTIASW